MRPLGVPLDRDSARGFEPLKADHPLVTGEDRCPACEEPFLAGERPTLVVDQGSPENVEARSEAGGGFYTAMAIPAHWTCVLTLRRVHEEIKDTLGPVVEATEARLRGA